MSLRPELLVALDGHIDARIAAHSAQRARLTLRHEIVLRLAPLDPWPAPELALYDLALPVRSWRQLEGARFSFPRFPRESIRDGLPVPVEPFAAGALVLGELRSHVRAGELAFGARAGKRIALTIAATIEPAPALAPAPFDVTLEAAVSIGRLLVRGDLSRREPPTMDEAMKMAAQLVELDDYGAPEIERWIYLPPKLDGQGA